MDWLNLINRYWPHLAAGFDFLAALLASAHALLHKRDTRAATLWIGVIWLMPGLGPVLYLVFGVNRIRRRAISLRLNKTFRPRHPRKPRRTAAFRRGTFENARARGEPHLRVPAHHRQPRPAARQRRRGVSRHARRHRIGQKIRLALLLHFRQRPDRRTIRRRAGPRRRARGGRARPD